MPDSDHSLEILITTKADLAGAKAAEAQLEQDAAKARALSEAYKDLDTQAENSPGNENAGTENGLSGIKQNGAETKNAHNGGDNEHKSAGGDRPSTGSGWDMTAAPGSDAGIGTGGEELLVRFQMGIDGLRLAAEALSEWLERAGIPHSVADEKSDRTSSGNPLPIPSPQPEDRPAGDDAAGMDRQQAPKATGQTEDETTGPFGESGAIQASGERMRAALEQNTQITVSLFNRTLELIDQQNRKLSDVDRKIAELSGQIKSLKNL